MPNPFLLNKNLFKSNEGELVLWQILLFGAVECIFMISSVIRDRKERDVLLEISMLMEQTN